jgi:hypothetical protein
MDREARWRTVEQARLTNVHAKGRRVTTPQHS